MGFPIEVTDHQQLGIAAIHAIAASHTLRADETREPTARKICSNFEATSEIDPAF
jgi:hypothetical protein